jgi:DNA-directed RNA polymerase subunit M/transcription elongation factor TFIIS
MKDCPICGTELTPEEIPSGICFNCQSIMSMKN